MTASSPFKVNNIENVFTTSTQNNIIPPTSTQLPQFISVGLEI